MGKPLGHSMSVLSKENCGNTFAKTETFLARHFTRKLWWKEGVDGAMNWTDCSAGPFSTWASKQLCSVQSRLFPLVIQCFFKCLYFPSVGGDYDHMVLQVDLGEEGLYLGEIGFGMTKVWEKTYCAWSIIFFYNSTKRNKTVSLQENYSPLKVEADIVQTMQTGHYKLTKDGEQWTIFWAPLEDNKPKTLDDENWERLFSFRLGECQLGDYEEASKYEWHLL